MQVVSRRSQVLAEEIGRLEPSFATCVATIEAHLDASAVFPLCAPLLAARKAATARAWSADWRGWGLRRTAMLAALPPEPVIIGVVLDLFAADLGGASLSDGLDAAGRYFPSHLILDDAVLGGDLRLEEAQVTGALMAARARVEGDVAADGAHITGPVELSGIAVSGSTRFAAAVCDSTVRLDDGSFGRELWLRGARFGAAFSMRRAQPGRDASLGCTYRGPASFAGTRFADTVSFEGASFAAALDLDGCDFGGVLWLNGLQLTQSATCRGTRFGGAVRPSVDVLRRGPGPRDMLAEIERAFARQGAGGQAQS